MRKLTYERLRAFLLYDPETGVFTRLTDTATRRHKAGTRAGSQAGRYRTMWIDNQPYLEHRIAWFWMTGSWPTGQMDHRNRNTHDNRWANLREATPSQNGMNRKGHSKSGIKGVYYKTGKVGRKKWCASIAKDGRAISLGLYMTKEEAAAAYAKAAIALHGEFARTA